ncbi:hypothetical protein, partial [Fischerella thermalis]|uniref:hypothetical protein n=1 Tax=Fischerella thermalis TaxID=372787 RepID=UPI001CA4796D
TETPKTYAKYLSNSHSSVISVPLWFDFLELVHKTEKRNPLHFHGAELLAQNLSSGQNLKLTEIDTSSELPHN